MGPLRVLHLPVARPGPGDAARHEHSDEGEGRDQAPAHLDSECGVQCVISPRAIARNRTGGCTYKFV